MIFGWLAQTLGMESAMIAHFAADIVLHVLLAVWEGNAQILLDSAASPG